MQEKGRKMFEHPKIIKSQKCKTCGKTQNLIEIAIGMFTWDHLCRLTGKQKIEFDIGALEAEIRILKRKLEELE
jgi:hypothetical protein